MELYSFSHMEKPQLMFYIKLSADSCRRIVITGKRRTITNVNLWHDDGCVVLTETKGGKNKKHRFTGCLVLWNSPSSMAHCPSISVCLRYESSIVGSQSGTKIFWKNWMVRALFPTPPSPTTTSLYVGRLSLGTALVAMATLYSGGKGGKQVGQQVADETHLAG